MTDTETAGAGSGAAPQDAIKRGSSETRQGNGEAPQPQENRWDAGALSKELAGRIEPLCRELLPHGVKQGTEWRCGSVQGEAGKSLGVCLSGDKAGVWSDFAAGDSGDALDLVKATLGVNTPEAMDWARSWLGLGPRPAAKRRPRRTADQRGGEAPAFSEDALALEFTAAHKDRLRYVATWKSWLQWNDKRWAFDNTEEVLGQVRHICRDASSRAEKAGTQNRIASLKTIKAVETLAQSDRRHAATPDQWDRNPWLLNTPDGTVDLETGNLLKHSPEDLITKSTAVGPAIGCPLWLEFLRRITDGDDALMQFLKRKAGYCLTGVTSEHALFFLYGTGANGKSVYTNTSAGIAGNYHVTAPPEVFMAARQDRHPTELAMLRGARMVTAVETEDGRRWAESRIKALTGGDPITARFMRADFFTFSPSFKLVFAGNHRPRLRNVDEAIRRRFFLVPFDVTIPADERDQTLSDRLRDEWPGILEWAIDGCLDWQENGLAPPDRVLAATEEYLSGEDALGTWLEEAVEEQHGAFEGSAVLFESYKAWADKAGEFVGTKTRFSQALIERGLEQGRTGKARGFVNIRLRVPDYTDREGY